MPWSFFARDDRISRRNRRYRRRGRRGSAPYCYPYGGNCSYHNYGDNFSDTDEEEERPRKPSPIPPLKVTRCDYNIDRNTKEHHTDEYDITQPNFSYHGPIQQLVVRRGQPFIITLELTRDYDESKDDLRLIFQFEHEIDEPTDVDGTDIEILLSDKDLPLKWGAKIEENTFKKLTIRVFTPPTICVGKWTFMVDVVKKSDVGSKVDRYNCDRKIYILFNPWCKDDTVYMSKRDFLEEYILNESGKIFFGSADSIGGRPWTFGQFEDKILDCVLYLLDQHEETPLKAKHRGDPIKVCRKLSALVNSQDDRGVLSGNWSGNYSGGTSPTAWTGSVKILKEFYSTKEPVCFGQCWVFSGVLTTVCRAIGIPARSVTNFSSAHDTDGDVIIDKIVTETGVNISSDSIWNFHVWNDVWMSRPDLPEGYDGWQALDATPQEASDGVYCCGPCPVKAIKAGNVLVPYDSPFIFAEVNADIVHWIRSGEDRKLQKIFIIKDDVGKNISTCMPCNLPFGRDREDITSEYKHEEGTELERKAVRYAVKHASKEGSNLIDELYIPAKEDVRFEFEDSGIIMLGQDFEVKLKICNESNENRTINGYMTVVTKIYTGERMKPVKSESFSDIKLSPMKVKILKLSVSVSDYMEKLDEQCYFEFSEIFTVKETNQKSIKKAEFDLKKPPLLIKAPANCRVGETIKVDVSFTNPLPVALTGCELGIQGPGLEEPVSYKKRNIGSFATYIDQFYITPKKKGKRTLIVNFNANEILMIEGSHTFTIDPENY